MVFCNMYGFTCRTSELLVRSKSFDMEKSVRTSFFYGSVLELKTRRRKPVGCSKKSPKLFLKNPSPQKAIHSIFFTYLIV